jgi:hypothetical protein
VGKVVCSPRLLLEEPVTRRIEEVHRRGTWCHQFLRSTTATGLGDGYLCVWSAIEELLRRAVKLIHSVSRQFHGYFALDSREFHALIATLVVCGFHVSRQQHRTSWELLPRPVCGGRRNVVLSAGRAVVRKPQLRSHSVMTSKRPQGRSRFLS